MKISIDIQPLFSGNRTGIGFYQTEMIRAMLRAGSGEEYKLNFFSLRNTGEKLKTAENIFGKGAEADVCGWFSSALAKKIWLLLPLPYSLFFPKRTDVSCFFNFTVPPFARGKKVVVIYDTVIRDFPETMSFKTKLVLSAELKRSIKRADKIVTISEFSKSRIMLHYGVSGDKIAVVPCGIRSDLFNPSYSGEQVSEAKKRYNITGEYLLYLGTLEPRKNIERLVESYARLRSEKPDCPALVIAGGKGWLYDPIFERVKSLGVEDSVIFTGYVRDEDVPPLMKGALCFCFPSLYEGFGMPPLEAMACGTPVITSDCSSLPEVVGNAAVTVDPYSVDELYGALKRVTEDPSLREELSRRGIERSGKFSWEKSAGIFLDTIKNI